MIYNKQISLSWSYFYKYGLLLFIALCGEWFINHTSARFDLTGAENYQIIEYKICGVFVGCICLLSLNNVFNKIYILKLGIILYSISVVYISNILPISTVYFHVFIMYGIGVSILSCAMLMIDFKQPDFCIKIWIISISITFLVTSILLYLEQNDINALSQEFYYLFNITLVILIVFSTQQIIQLYSTKYFIDNTPVNLKFILLNSKNELIVAFLTSHFIAGFLLKPDYNYYHYIISHIYTSLSNSLLYLIFSACCSILLFIHSSYYNIKAITLYFFSYFIFCNLLQFSFITHSLIGLISFTCTVIIFNIYQLSLFGLISKFKRSYKPIAILFYITACFSGMLLKHNWKGDSFFLSDYILFAFFFLYYYCQIIYKKNSLMVSPH
ncbi:MAG: hypothetical protein DGJ47_001073 [Rickettsiaceae bacterium]